MRGTLATFGVLLLILLAVLVVYWFVRYEVAKESVAVASAQAQIDLKSANADRVTAAKEALADLANNESLIQNYFVSQAGVVSFINDLEQRGAALGAVVSIDSVAAVDQKKNGGRSALELALSITGPFDAVMRTVGSIEYAPYDLSATGFSLNMNGDETGGWLAHLALYVGSSPAPTSTPKTRQPKTTSP